MEQMQQKQQQPPELTPKQRKMLLIAVVALFFLISFIAIMARGAEQPFKKLRPEDITSATVTTPQKESYVPLSEDDIFDLTGILNAVKIYQQDDNWQETNGQMVIFTIGMTDGTQRTVAACTPWLIIDGVGYRTEYEPCQALNTLANQVLGDS